MDQEAMQRRSVTDQNGPIADNSRIEEDMPADYYNIVGDSEKKE